MFDLRGLKAVSPGALQDLGEIDEWLYHSKAVKVGTVFDSLIAKVQHLRTAQNSKAREMFENGRSRIFIDPDECRAWLTEELPEKTAG